MGLLLNFCRLPTDTIPKDQSRVEETTLARPALNQCLRSCQLPAPLGQWLAIGSVLLVVACTDGSHFTGNKLDGADAPPAKPETTSRQPLGQTAPTKLPTDDADASGISGSQVVSAEDAKSDPEPDNANAAENRASLPVPIAGAFLTMSCGVTLPGDETAEASRATARCQLQQEQQGAMVPVAPTSTMALLVTYDKDPATGPDATAGSQNRRRYRNLRLADTAGAVVVSPYLDTAPSKGQSTNQSTNQSTLPRTMMSPNQDKQAPRRQHGKGTILVQPTENEFVFELDISAPREEIHVALYEAFKESAANRHSEQPQPQDQDRHQHHERHHHHQRHATSKPLVTGAFDCAVLRELEPAEQMVFAFGFGL